MYNWKSATADYNINTKNHYKKRNRMKYQLETIPIWDTYEKETECPLCFLQQKLEKQNISFFLGSSVMEPDIRKKVNESGFCQTHFTMLYDEGNRLSLSLMIHSHLLLLLKGLGKFKKNLGHKSYTEYILSLKNKKYECVLCRRLEKALKRYTFTIVYLWKKEEEFRDTFQKSRGFCFSHFSDCISMADEVLSSKKKDQFLQEIYTLQMKNLVRIEEDIHWFIQKHDYKNSDKSWKNSKDAPKRTIQKLIGKIPR